MFDIWSLVSSSSQCLNYHLATRLTLVFAACWGLLIAYPKENNPDGLQVHFVVHNMVYLPLHALTNPSVSTGRLYLIWDRVVFHLQHDSGRTPIYTAWNTSAESTSAACFSPCCSGSREDPSALQCFINIELKTGKKQCIALESSCRHGRNSFLWM